MSRVRGQTSVKVPVQGQQVARSIQDDASTLRHVTLRLDWEAERYLARAVSIFQITLPQFMTLAALRHHEQGLTMSNLAAATITGIIDRLVARGQVSRKRDPLDRRACGFR
jgi:DNA-binding MarR family transcriptional regulator